MALNAKTAPSNSGSGSSQDPIEDGSYPCRVVQVLDLGIQPQQPYQGKEKPPAHMMMMTYEFLDEFCVDEDGKELEDKPRWLSEDFPLYNLNADKAKSSKRYMAIDPDLEHEGDFTKLVGSPCVVTVVQREGSGRNAGKVYNNVASVSVMRPKDAAKAVELVNPPKVFELDEPDMEVFGSLPEWVQDKIKGNLEFQGSALQKALGETPDENANETDGDEDGENSDGKW